MKGEGYNYTFRIDSMHCGSEEIQNLKNIVSKLIIITSAVDNYEAMERLISYKKECSLIADEWNEKIKILSDKYFNQKNNLDTERRGFKKKKQSILEINIYLLFILISA